VNSWGQPNDIGAAPSTEEVNPSDTNPAIDLPQAMNKMAVPQTTTDSSIPTAGGGDTIASSTFNPDDYKEFSSQSLGTTPPSKDTRAKFAVNLANHLQKKYNLSDNQVAGIIGNFTLESRMAPNMREGLSYGGPLSPMGNGLAQWTGLAGGQGVDTQRGKQFQMFCEKHGLDINSEVANVAFLDHELTNPGNDHGPAFEKLKLTLSELKKTTSVQSATQVWVTNFENASMPNTANRITMANNFLAFWKGGDETAYRNDLMG